MLKKWISVLCALLLLSVPATALAAGVTDAPTPTMPGHLLFAKKLGTGYRFAPTPPVVEQGTLLTVSGMRLYKLDAKTGEEIAGVKTAGRTMYTVVSPTVADGVVYVALDDGILQAFDFETLTPLWIYRDPLQGQALTRPVLADGDLYCAFWNGETDEANYFCLRAADEDPAKQDEEKTAVWTYSAPGGFYRAEAAVYGEWLIFGGEDGARESVSGADSRITALNRRTGKAASTLPTKGDLRSETVYDPAGNCFYICSKAGILYRFACDPGTGALSLLNRYQAAGSMTAAPVLYGGRLYTGCQNGMEGKFLVLDAQTLEEIYSADLPGYPQARMLLSTAEADFGGRVRIYTTYNRAPGGIVGFTDAPGQTEAKAFTLFTPDESMQQYCIAPLSAGPDGTIYYKNDSGNLFAVGPTDFETVLVRGFRNLLRAWIRRLVRLLKGGLNDANRN